MHHERLHTKDQTATWWSFGQFGGEYEKLPHRCSRPYPLRCRDLFTALVLSQSLADHMPCLLPLTPSCASSYLLHPPTIYDPPLHLTVCFPASLTSCPAGSQTHPPSLLSILNRTHEVTSVSKLHFSKSHSAQSIGRRRGDQRLTSRGRSGDGGNKLLRINLVVAGKDPFATLSISGRGLEAARCAAPEAGETQFTNRQEEGA